jgi:uroporphyrinogen-III synthase
VTQLQTTLANLTIAVPETRELDVFSDLLERRGAKVVRCPLVAILDAPDPAPVLAWVRAFNAGGCDDVILLTGEGLRRIVRCIDTHEPTLRDAFVLRLASARKITRGPKPAKALRELGLKPDLTAVQPTTAGVIESLRSEDLAGRRVGVQLYGTDPNRTLIDFLVAAGAQPLTVAPYIYASKADDTAVSDLLTRMATGEVNVIAFTSSPQVERLFAVGPPDLVKAALERVQVAAIGPVVAAALAKHDVRVRLMPEDSFFMKPLATAMEAELGRKATDGATADG